MKEKKNSNQIFVTRPSLPLLEDFIPYFEDIWDNRWLTNYGRYHQEFEQKLSAYLGVKDVALFANGTLALIIALQELRITGEVITTPYSFVATTHALHWNGISPVFCDIEPETMNINPDKIESLITPKTTAILPVHVYGNPCNIGEIQEIADTYGLKVIYDAAHAFGVKINNTPVVKFGNHSILSFHATKVFTTFEGGAIICNDKSAKQRIKYLQNFGFANETTVMAPGINAKMNEMQASLGILQLNRIDENINKRKEIANHYQICLKDCKGISFIQDQENIERNYQYFPVFVDEVKYGRKRDELYEELKRNNIFGRRYFYPLISQFPVYRNLPSASPENLPVAERITRQVICLPIYPDLEISAVNNIANIILEYGKKR